VKKQRLQFDLSPEALKDLDELREMADVSTRAELIRKALRLYNWFLAQKRDGGEFLVKKGEEVKKIEFLG
jgi:metal-responsive CopG/Arc/MetJ family transcriptional regulator